MTDPNTPTKSDIVEMRMATLASYAIVPDVSGYTSDRVINGVRQLDGKAAAKHRARLKKALANWRRVKS